MAGKTQGSYAATYGYRFGDKLKAVTSSFPGEAPSVGYKYDGLGKRRVEQLGTSTLTWFRWLGWEESGEYTGTPGTWTIGAMQTGYVPGLATFAGANPSTAEWRYPLTDHLGSVRQLTAQNKAALARYDYAPYGELMRSSGLPLTVGYTGHRWDPAIGQYFAPFRYYNPQTARWNMRDPLGFVDGPNVYAYVAGNPIMYSDSLGLDRCIMSRYPSWKVWRLPWQHWWIRIDVYDRAGKPIGQVDLHHSPHRPDWYQYSTKGEPEGVVREHITSNKQQDEELQKQWISDLEPDGKHFKPTYKTGKCKWACYKYRECGMSK